MIDYTRIPIGWNGAAPLLAQTSTTEYDDPNANSTVRINDVNGLPLLEIQLRPHRPFYTLVPYLGHGVVICAETFHAALATPLSIFTAQMPDEQDEEPVEEPEP